MCVCARLAVPYNTVHPATRSPADTTMRVMSPRGPEHTPHCVGFPAPTPGSPDTPQRGIYQQGRRSHEGDNLLGNPALILPPVVAMGPDLWPTSHQIG